MIMDSSTRNKIMVDLVRLEKEVRAKAVEYLEDISEGNLKAFAESTKFIAQSVLEKFYFDIDDLYTVGVLKLQDENQLKKFSDFHDGYRAKMRAWSNQNPISIREMKIVAPSAPPQKEENFKRAPIALASGGTLIAVGLAIAGVNIWVVAAAELLMLASATYLFKTQKSQSEYNYAFKVHQYEMQLEQEKQRLVNGLIKDLKTWLNIAESYSDDLLASFGII